MTQDAQDESLEESIFKTLSNQKRRDILRMIGEGGNATFTEIMHIVGIEDGPSLSYHLNAMRQLLVQKEGRYGLSELGRETYNLLSKISTHAAATSVVSSLRREISAAIVANAILWAAAILSVSTFEGRLQQITLSSFAALWFMSNTVLYLISARLRK